MNESINNSSESIRFRNDLDSALKGKKMTKEEAIKLLTDFPYVNSKADTIRYTINSLRSLKSQLDDLGKGGILKANLDCTWADKGSIVKSIQTIAENDSVIMNGNDSINNPTIKNNPIKQPLKTQNINDLPKKTKKLSLNEFTSQIGNSAVIGDSLSVGIGGADNPLAKVGFPSIQILNNVINLVKSSNGNLPKKIFVLAGTNDVISNVSVSETINNIDNIAKIAKENNIEFIPGLIPPMGKFLDKNFANGGKKIEIIKKIKRINAHIMGKYPLFIDYPSVLSSPNNKDYINDKFDGGDGLHMSPLGYNQMRKCILEKQNISMENQYLS